MRLNECGRKGSFYELCREFGESADQDHNYIQPQKTRKYKIPDVKTQPPSSKVIQYLTSRGFSQKTWERRGVAEVNGAIALPYYENGQLVLMKYRTPEKPSKHWREEGGKPVFWGMDLCAFEKPLVITEGELDALALDECCIPNVVSVPSGASDLTCVELCWDWLDRFNKIVVWGDNDVAGKDMVNKLILKLGHIRCFTVDSSYKDANVHLYKEGKESVKQAIANAKEVPVAGITRVADIKRLDLGAIERVNSCIPGINKILGGYRLGELTVWTGINSSGKSTFLGQEVIESIDQGFPVFAYSGELSQVIFKEWIHQQMAGPNYLEMKYDRIRDRNYGLVSHKVAAELESWYSDMFYLYDTYTTDEANLLDLCEIAARRYGCKIFLVDNLMTTGLGGIKNDNLYQAQAEFTRRLANFAKRYEAHVHLVAHPRKAYGKLTKMDISGSADISNRADNVVALHRFSPSELADPDCMEHYEGCDALIQIFKNRFYGTQDVEIGVKFDSISKRFYSPTDEIGPSKKYGWIKQDEYQHWQELAKQIEIKD